MAVDFSTLKVFGELPPGWRGETHVTARSFLCGFIFSKEPPRYRNAFSIEACNQLIDWTQFPYDARLVAHLRNMCGEWRDQDIARLKNCEWRVDGLELVLTNLRKFDIWTEQIDYQADVSWAFYSSDSREEVHAMDFQRGRWWEHFWSAQVFFHPLFCDGHFCASVLAIANEFPEWIRVDRNLPLFSDAQVVEAIERHFDVFI